MHSQSDLAFWTAQCYTDRKAPEGVASFSVLEPLFRKDKQYVDFAINSGRCVFLVFALRSFRLNTS